MSNASRCARYYANRKEKAADLQDRVSAQERKIFALKERVNTLERENERLREALLLHAEVAR